MYEFSEKYYNIIIEFCYLSIERIGGTLFNLD